MLHHAGCLQDPHSLIPINGFTDPVSSLSHLVVAIIFAAKAVSLLRTAQGSRSKTLALAIYAGSVVLLFTMSGVFHLLDHSTSARNVLQRLDHASIFVLIAGTFTAIHGVLFRGPMRWGVITFAWLVTAIAIPLKTVFFNQIPESVGLTLYLAFPWVGLLTGITLWRRRGLHYITWLVLGGIAYTVGAVLEFKRWPNPWPGYIHAHELFHFFAIIGAACHWRFCSMIASESAAQR